MPRNLVEKIIEAHLRRDRDHEEGTIAVSVDQTLFHDVSGTMASLEFDALNIPRVRTELSVAYIDHNTLQVGFENADDHLFIQSFAARYGLYLSRCGNGICHQVHLERFSVPGKMLLGADSHTPTAGGMGMLAIGVGGLDVALAMAGEPFYLRPPKVIQVRLLGKLSPWVSAKDIILEILRRYTVKGGVGKILEYGGPGVKNLTVPERATIANMGAELGATTSIFPSDECTLAFLKAQQRDAAWTPLYADPNAHYDDIWEIDLGSLEPLIAQPHSPDNVCAISTLEGLKVDQVVIGSCTNSSFKDLLTVSKILKEKYVSSHVSLVISPGSRQVLKMLSMVGALADLIETGARILECSCGPCVGMGQAPCTDGVSLRTINRNFKGRSGTLSSKTYLASPEVAAASAIDGAITDPRRLGDAPTIRLPEACPVEDHMILTPLLPEESEKIKLVRGPNIKPLPLKTVLPEKLSGRIIIKLEDNITTDDILPSGAKVFALRSNIPAISEYVFESMDPDFVRRVKGAGGGFIVAGENYGQGSAREHAAIAPMFLGIQAIVAKSFARIHRSNLINFGILPLILKSDEDYQSLDQGDEIEIELEGPIGEVSLINKSKNRLMKLEKSLSEREWSILKQGGSLAFVKRKIAEREKSAKHKNNMLGDVS